MTIVAQMYCTFPMILLTDSNYGGDAFNLVDGSIIKPEVYIQTQ